MSEHIVMGIDTNTYGWHMVASGPVQTTHNGWKTTETYGWYQAPGKDADERRPAIFAEAVSFFAALPRATAVFVEEPLVLPKNIDTTRKLIAAAAVLEAAFWQAKPDATWFWVPLSTWRRVVLGKGSGTRVEMDSLAQTAVTRIWYRELHVSVWNQMEAVYDQEPDLYDAHCIMLYGMNALAGNQVQIR